MLESFTRGCFVFVVSLAVGVAGSRESVFGQEVTVGAVLPLTGEASQWGTPALRGAQVALDVSRRDGDLGTLSIKLVPEDSGCDPKRAVAGVQKLLTSSRDLVAVIGDACSSATIAMHPLLSARQVVEVSPIATSPKVSDLGPFIFRVVPSDSYRGELFADYLFRDRKVSKVAVIYVQNEGGEGGKNSFVQRYNANGGAVVAEESYGEGAQDLRAQLVRLNAKNPDGIVAISYPSDSALIARQARELGIKQQLYYQSESPDDPSVRAAGGGAMVGSLYILSAKPSGRAYDDFRAAYRERFKEEPPLYAAEGRDSMKLILESLRSCQGTLTGLCVQKALALLKPYEGASGLIAFDSNGDVKKPMEVREVTADGSRVVATLGRDELANKGVQ